MMRKRLIDVKPLITHTVPPAEAETAFRLAADKGRAVKIQIAFSRVQDTTTGRVVRRIRLEFPLCETVPPFDAETFAPAMETFKRDPSFAA